MDRLTYWNSKNKRSALPKQINELGDTYSIEEVCAKLADFEDSEEDGRLFISPFQIGQKVYLTPNYIAYWNKIEEATITGASLFSDGDWQIVTSTCLCYRGSDIGKNGIYLTREEAEYALESGKYK